MQRTDSRLADLHWDDVRLFLALARAPTLSRAARELGVDVSTVSRRLAALEETLGATLFDRGRNGLSPSPAVDALFPVAEEIEDAMGRFAGAAESLEREVRGLVRIACPPDAAEVLIVPHLPELMQRHPNVRIELLAEEGLVDVSRRDADIALRIVRPERGDLIVRTLFRIDSILCATPDVAERLGTVRDLERLPWITFGDRFARIPAARWVTNSVQAQPRIRSDNIRVQIAAVASGLGVALLPAPSAAFYGFVPVELSRRLRSTLSQWPTDDVFLVTHRALRRVPRVRAVWDFLLERKPEV